jgi:hypothetical protein
MDETRNEEEMVKFLVGRAGTEIFEHKRVMCYSPVLSAAFNNGEEQFAFVIQETAEVFFLLVDWLSYQNLDRSPEAHDKYTPTSLVR